MWTFHGTKMEITTSMNRQASYLTRFQNRKYMEWVNDLQWLILTIGMANTTNFLTWPCGIVTRLSSCILWTNHSHRMISDEKKNSHYMFGRWNYFVPGPYRLLFYFESYNHPKQRPLLRHGSSAPSRLRAECRAHSCSCTHAVAVKHFIPLLFK